MRSFLPPFPPPPPPPPPPVLGAPSPKEAPSRTYPESTIFFQIPYVRRALQVSPGLFGGTGRRTSCLASHVPRSLGFLPFVIP